MKDKHIGILGAGIVGLSTALYLQKIGYKVTIIDKEEPGMGASFGNAGLFADYARLPFAKFSMLRKVPNMLMDKNGSLSIQTRYLPHIMQYGYEFTKACFKDKYAQGKAAMKFLQERSLDADQELIALTNAQHLIRGEGCLGLFSTTEGLLKAKQGDLKERQEQGVNMQFVSANDVRDMEPDLASFHSGGVFYPDTRFTVSPVLLSRQYAHHFTSNGGCILQDEVLVLSTREHDVSVHLSDSTLTFDEIVVCTGLASKKILARLDLKVPLVSERGYHLMLNAGCKTLQRPVGWLDKAIFMTPMEDSLRLAGMAEFAFEHTSIAQARLDTLLQHANVMLGPDAQATTTWVGSRPSTPDSLPFIGPLEQHPRIKVAFGHGHLGLTFAAITGKLIAQSIQNPQNNDDLTPFLVSRFG
ncbi:FAD-dependent oxidoreductase [Marinomonas arenicola]|uniref:NAD(P)/FAD-dependent oxidoreductase n=1 Tax=Marinomonas arenicola TaxID=569601 RepID=UPI00311F4DBE